MQHLSGENFQKSQVLDFLVYFPIEFLLSGASVKSPWFTECLLSPHSDVLFLFICLLPVDEIWLLLWSPLSVLLYNMINTFAVVVCPSWVTSNDVVASQGVQTAFKVLHYWCRTFRKDIVADMLHLVVECDDVITWHQCIASKNGIMNCMPYIWMLANNTVQLLVAIVLPPSQQQRGPKAEMVVRLEGLRKKFDNDSNRRW